MAVTTFVISVAAELAGMHPQTLRQYDRLGLVTPARTKGRGRRYTYQDVEKLREIQRLSQEEGVNLEGVRQILQLREELLETQEKLQRLQTVAENVRNKLSAFEARRDRVFTASPRGDVFQSRRGKRPRAQAGALVPATGALVHVPKRGYKALIRFNDERLP
ncbi:heat shock protein transcriptional repressor HspR [Gleimia hominis]|uniref:heat shock protein transcriptional repressor HspR n=1 Tax=Gleimia hominis TaxID=595468 RepID=UPI000C80A8D3|nr:helix-turn-helix transcriptional regulator [Gleimia hominis]WIK64459.1 helix-turn-helix transcriptional regulator [Gleimia hominis]